MAVAIGVGVAYVVIVIVLPAFAAFAGGLIGQCHWQALSLAISRAVLHVDLASKLVPTGKERLLATHAENQRRGGQSKLTFSDYIQDLGFCSPT